MSKIAFLVDNEYEDSEFQEPYDALKKAGHDVTIVGLEAGKRIEGKRGKSKATVEVAASRVKPADFDALVIPGGHSPDKVRMNEAAVAFTRGFFDAKKPVAAICHGPQVLIEANVVHNRTLTSWPSVKTDLKNAGALWVDREVVEDGNLVTSRKPDDIPAFIRAFSKQLAADARPPVGERSAPRPESRA